MGIAAAGANVSCKSECARYRGNVLAGIARCGICIGRQVRHRGRIGFINYFLLGGRAMYRIDGNPDFYSAARCNLGTTCHFDNHHCDTDCVFIAIGKLKTPGDEMHPES